ncbi:MAG: hypothetical protein JWP18_1654, partial [Solirubrobacterales bacterium]|nr:hypothetical protein [Solirubrobacterales bacterium]
MSAVTRRGLLGGAAAGLAVPVIGRVTGLAAAAPLPASAPHATRTVVRRGRAIAVSPRGDRLVVAHDQRRTIAIVAPGKPQRLVDVGGQPLDVAVAPAGRLAAVTTAAWDEPGLAFVDLRTGKVRRRLDVGPRPCRCAFTPDGRLLLVTGGEQEGTVHVIDAHRLTLLTTARVGLAPRSVVAGRRNGGRAWVALNGEAHVVGIDPRTGRIRRTLRAPGQPDRLALSPDGTRLLVTHGGRRADRVSELHTGTGALVRRTAGPLVSAVGWTHDGRRLVALGGEAAVVLLR